MFYLSHHFMKRFLFCPQYRMPSCDTANVHVCRDRWERRDGPENARRHGVEADRRSELSDGQFDANGFSNVADRPVVSGVWRLRDQLSHAEHAQIAAADNRRHDDVATSQDGGGQSKPTVRTTETGRHHDHSQLRQA